MEYSASTINKIESLKNGTYSTFSMAKNKYTVKGGIIGTITGMALAMYFRKSVFAGAVLGTITGILAGNLIGNIIIKRNKNKTQKNE